MTQPRRGLGRGLDALFSSSAPAAPPPVPQPAVQEPDSPAYPAEPPREETPAARTEPEPVRIAPEPVRQEPEPPRYEAEPPRYEPRREPIPEPVATVQPQPIETPAAAARAAQIVRRGGPEELDIDLIAPNPEQPRTHFEPEKLRELSDSIREHGIIQPLVVSRDDAGGYHLIAGERRLQAARLAGLHSVPVVIRDASSTDSELLELALIENIQRADLNAIEEAQAYRRLIEEYGLTQEEAARRVGKSRVTVSNALRLLQLEGEIRRSLVAGEITEGHARALLGLPEGRGRVNAWREVVKRKLSVRDTEGFVRRSLAEAPATAQTPGATTPRRDAQLSDIEQRLRRALSTRVTVQPQKRGARILIECYSTEEFDNVVATLLGEYA